jgi:hypothetical protein
MLKIYKLLYTAIIAIIFLSILKVDNLVDQQVGNYTVLAVKTMLFNITKLNWQYGFFTSKSDGYQYLKTDISLVDQQTGALVQQTINGTLNGFGNRYPLHEPHHC